jgi:hypothetical protein
MQPLRYFWWREPAHERPGETRMRPQFSPLKCSEPGSQNLLLKKVSLYCLSIISNAFQEAVLQQQCVGCDQFIIYLVRFELQCIYCEPFVEADKVPKIKIAQFQRMQLFQKINCEHAFKLLYKKMLRAS